MKYPKRSQYKYAQFPNRIRNWPVYEEGLRRRDDLTIWCSEAAHAHGEGRTVRVLIPPGRDARLTPRPSAALMERNRNNRSIRTHGRLEWHKRSGLSKRSMVENAIYRYKTIIGRGIRSRALAGQRAEVQLACMVLKPTTRLGMPDSYRVV